MHRLNAMKKLVQGKIRWQIFLSFALLNIVALMALFWFIYHYAANQATDQRYAAASVLGNQIDSSIEQYIEGFEKLSLNYLFSTEMRDLMNGARKGQDLNAPSYLRNYNSVRRQMIAYLALYRQIDGIYLYDMQGECLVQVNRKNYVYAQNALNDHWFQTAVARKGLSYLIGSHPSMTGEKTVFSTVRAMIDVDNYKFTGVIRFDMETDSLASIIRDTAIDDFGVAVILDEAGHLAYTNGDALWEGGLNSLDLHAFEDANGIWQEIRGERYYIVRNQSEVTQWQTLICSRESEIFRDVGRLRATFVTVAVFVAAATVIFAFFLAGRITGPLLYIAQQIRRFTGGDLKVRIDAVGGNEVAVLGSHLNEMIGRIETLVEKEYLETMRRQETELKLLQSQINPHFLYNTLGLIINEAEKEGAFKSSEMMQKLALIFRYNLGKSGNAVTVSDEIEHIQNYLDLQVERFNGRLTVVYDVDEIAKRGMLPRMTMQPLVENCIIHGFHDLTENCRIHIRARTEGETIVLSISDNGQGLDAERVACLNAPLRSQGGMPTEGMGIQNVNARIRFMFGEGYGLRYVWQAQGALVEVVLPSGGEAALCID